MKNRSCKNGLKYLISNDFLDKSRPINSMTNDLFFGGPKQEI